MKKNQNRQYKVVEKLARDVDNRIVLKIFLSAELNGKGPKIGISLSQDPTYSFVILDDNLQKSLENDLRGILFSSLSEEVTKKVYDLNREDRKLLFTFRNNGEIKATMRIVAARFLSVDMGAEDLNWMLEALEHLKDLKKTMRENREDK